MRTLLASTILAALVLSTSTALAAWTPATPLPTPRAQLGATVDLSGAIHIIAGGEPELTDHEVLLADGGWFALAPLPAAARAGATMTGADGTLYYVGGYRNGTGELGAAYAFGLDGGWTTLPDSGVVSGWETSGDVGADGKVYVFGGEGNEITDAGDLGFTNSKTQIYDPVGNAWSLGADMPARRQYHRALRGSDGLFYIIGGIDNDDHTASTVFVYNPTTNSWANGPSIPVTEPDAGVGFDAGDAAPPGIVSFGAVAVLGRTKLVVAGGSNDDGNNSAPYFQNVYVFDVPSQMWSQLTTLTAGRRELAAAADSCTLHVLGGSDGGQLDTHETLSLDDLCVSDPDGPECIPDTTAHCGCTGPGDCTKPGTTCTSAHICAAPPDAGEGDAGGGGRDGGGGGGSDASLGSSDSGAGSDAGANDSGSSSGCSCTLVSTGDSGSLAALAALGIFGTLASRRRSRRTTRR
jgi:MYXO-CTERM domain-containing protein